MDKKIRILIVDDHTVLRQGTRSLLAQEPDLEVVGEAGDGEEAVALAAQVKPDVILMDIAMPKLDGIGATKQIKTLHPEISVLVLSAYDDDQFIFRLLQAGAAGYLLKSVHARELIAAIRAVSQGESVLHPSIARKVLSRFVPTATTPANSARSSWELSQREMDFLKLMVKGMSNKEIASEIGLSIRTVQGYLRQIFKKLGVSSRTEAVVYALKENLITLDDLPRSEMGQKLREDK